MRNLVGASRIAEKYLGWLLCSLLGLLPGPKTGPAAAPKKILVMKFWEAGVLVLGAAYFRALRRRYPEAKIVFLTLDINSEICSMLGAADEILPLRISGGLLPLLYDLARAVPALRKEHFDLILDLEFLSRFSAVLSCFMAPSASVGFSSARYWRGRLHGISVPFSEKKHICDNYAAFFSALDIFPAPEDYRELEWSVLGLEELVREPYIVVNFDKNSLIPERNWPEERLSELVFRLAGKAWKTVLIGSRPGSGETWSVGVEDLRGRLNFRQLAGLLKHARLFITQDSGPMHIAAAMNTPAVCLFGPESPLLYGPRNPRHTVIYKNPGCSPCVDVFRGKKLDCVRGRNECMLSITVDEVLAAALRVLEAEK